MAGLVVAVAMTAHRWWLVMEVPSPWSQPAVYVDAIRDWWAPALFGVVGVLMLAASPLARRTRDAVRRGDAMPVLVVSMVALFAVSAVQVGLSQVSQARADRSLEQATADLFYSSAEEIGDERLFVRIEGVGGLHMVMVMSPDYRPAAIALLCHVAGRPPADAGDDDIRLARDILDRYPEAGRCPA
ncbi:hypothetical protein [Polymorphospora sp. NPDC050346]|uniref:hypothetical protein n=1 Tax=Polymorphospora sp. NPDC050346 TaxID=3155780 RepID=UPI0033E39E4F